MMGQWVQITRFLSIRQLNSPKEVNTVFAQSDDWTCTNKNKSLYHVTEVNKIKVRKVKSDYSTYFPIEKSSPKNI